MGHEGTCSRSQDQSTLLELLRLDAKMCSVVTNQLCLAIVSDEKNWRFDALDFTAMRKKVFAVRVPGVCAQQCGV